MTRLSASRVAPFSLLVPVFGMAPAGLPLDDVPSPIALAGAMVGLSGLGLVCSEVRCPSRGHRSQAIPQLDGHDAS